MAKVTLKAIRVNMGLTRKELGDKMGVSDDTIARWENGQAEIKTAYLYMLCGLSGFKEEDILLPEKSS